MAQTLHFTTDRAFRRLDLFLTGQCGDLSRSEVQRLIAEGHVTVDGATALPSSKLGPGRQVSVNIPDPIEGDLVPEELPLNIVYQDSEILVVDKAAGMTVHPAPGHPTGTLANAVLALCPDLRGIGGTAPAGYRAPAGQEHLRPDGGGEDSTGPQSPVVPAEGEALREGVPGAGSRQPVTGRCGDRGTDRPRPQEPQAHGSSCQRPRRRNSLHGPGASKRLQPSWRSDPQPAAPTRSESTCPPWVTRWWVTHYTVGPSQAWTGTSFTRKSWGSATRQPAHRLNFELNPRPSSARSCTRPATERNFPIPSYPVGQPSGISLVSRADMMASAASPVTQPVQMSVLVFSHQRAESFVSAFGLSPSQATTSA